MLPLYKNIKNLRLSINMSQETLAKLTGYTDRSSIARIEKGEIDLPQSKIVQFANALGVTPGTLMGWEENETQLEFLPGSELTARIVPRIIEDELFSKAVEVLESMDQKELTAFIALFDKR